MRVETECLIFTIKNLGGKCAASLTKSAVSFIRVFRENESKPIIEFDLKQIESRRLGKYLFVVMLIGYEGINIQDLKID